MKSLKTVVVAAVFSLSVVSAFAQSHPSAWTPPSLPTDYVGFDVTGETTDTVTAGSRMAYRQQAPAVVIPGTGMEYQYQWLFTDGSNKQSWSIVTQNSTVPGTGLTPASGDFYTQNEIAVEIPAATTLGQYVMKGKIRSTFQTNELCATGETSANIQVVAPPSMTWSNTGAAFCYQAPQQSVNISQSFTGFGQWKVEYQITSTDLEGNNAETPLYGESTVGTTHDKVGSHDLQIDGTILTRTNPEQGGIYKVKILKLTDRISRKSLTEVLGSFPSDEFIIVIAPMPVNTKLEHVKNM